MAEVRFYSTRYQTYPSYCWPYLWFAKSNCDFGNESDLGSIRNIDKCPIVQKLNTNGQMYHIVDHINQDADIFVPYSYKERFQSMLDLCKQCPYNANTKQK